MSDVLFPIVGRGEASLATVRCDGLDPKDYPAGRALVLARDEREIERILADSRSCEPTGAEIARPIWVRFIPQQFSGRSYGLALALADKLARYCRQEEPQDRRVFATGIVVEDGSGRIGGVEAFDGKLAVIAREARSGDVVVVPQANLDHASCDAREMLARFEKTGVVCRGADHLDQLGDLHGASTADLRVTASPAETSGMGRGKPFRPAAAAGADPETSTGMSIGSGTADPSRVGALHPPVPDTRRWLRTGAMAVAGLAIGAAAFKAGGLSNDDGIVASHANEVRQDDAASARNLIENASFERGEGQQPVGWETFSRGQHDHADYVIAGGIDGSLVLEHGSQKAFYVETHQILEIPNGVYAVSAWVDSDGAKKANRMFARGEKRIEADIPETPPGHFEQLRINCVRVTEERLSIGFYTDAQKHSSARYDDVRLLRNAEAVDGQDCQDVLAAGVVSANVPAKLVDRKKPRLIEVSDGDNLLKNPSFESGEGQRPAGWLTYSRELHDDADRVVAGGIDGSLVLEHGGDEAFYVDTHQVLHVPNGLYTFSAWIDSDGPKKANRMYAHGDDRVEVDIPVTAQHSFEKLQIDCIKVTKGRIVVGFYTDVHHPSRTAYDDLQLVRRSTTVDGRDCAA